MNSFVLYIYSHCPKFKRFYKLFNACENYASFRSITRFDYSEVHIIKTSSKCYRVIHFVGKASRPSYASYMSFRTLEALFEHLESLGLCFD